MEVGDPARTALQARCDAIEDSYEFMLAYAAKGLPHDPSGADSGNIRDALRRCETAIAGLADFMRGYVDRLGLEPADDYRAFIDVLDRDAVAAVAALRLVLAQSGLSSQLVDNLNASIHVRTLLTDLFLIDEVLKQRSR